MDWPATGGHPDSNSATAQTRRVDAAIQNTDATLARHLKQDLLPRSTGRDLYHHRQRSQKLEGLLRTPEAAGAPRGMAGGAMLQPKAATSAERHPDPQSPASAPKHGRQVQPPRKLSRRAATQLISIARGKALISPVSTRAMA